MKHLLKVVADGAAVEVDGAERDVAALQRPNGCAVHRLCTAVRSLNFYFCCWVIFAVYLGLFG